MNNYKTLKAQLIELESMTDDFPFDWDVLFRTREAVNNKPDIKPFDLLLAVNIIHFFHDETPAIFVERYLENAVKHGKLAKSTKHELMEVYENTDLKVINDFGWLFQWLSKSQDILDYERESEENQQYMEDTGNAFPYGTRTEDFISEEDMQGPRTYSSLEEQFNALLQKSNRYSEETLETIRDTIKTCETIVPFDLEVGADVIEMFYDNAPIEEVQAVLEMHEQEKKIVRVLVYDIPIDYMDAKEKGDEMDWDRLFLSLSASQLLLQTKAY